MTPNRPDLSRLEPEILAYIQMLELEIKNLNRGQLTKRKVTGLEAENDELGPLEENEPPTTINLISATAGWNVKRTPRHLYARQRRGGMGIFDLDTPSDDPVVVLSTADEGQVLLLITDKARVFRIPLSNLPESPVRSKGLNLKAKFKLEPDEKLAAILPEQAQGYLTSISRQGFVRMLRHHVFGDAMKPGMILFDTRLHGPLAGAIWSSGDGDLFLATQQGKAIRFAEKLIPPGGAQGIRLDEGDGCIAISPVDQESIVFLLGSDGKGTIRPMENFIANKTPGSGGKQALHTSGLIAARSVQAEDDLFIISQLSKIIRFSVNEVPQKEGVVQGVVCMSLRADTPVALTSKLI